MITYANWLISNGNTSFANTIWPIIKLDLDYVMNNWNQTTFDLWEEVESSSFFTTAVQHRALREGSTLASKLGQVSSISSGYTTQAANALCFLQVSWHTKKQFTWTDVMTSRTGIRRVDMSLQIPAQAVGPEKIPIRSWQASIRLTRPLDATPLHCNHVPTVPYLIWKYTSIRSGPYTASIVVLRVTPPQMSAGTRKMCIKEEM